VQSALTVLLLTGTGLLVHSFTRALAVDVGYDARQVLAVDVALPPSSYADPAHKLAFYDAALAALRSAPGIRAAGVTSVLPHETSAITADTQRDHAASTSVFAGYRLVDPGYFDAIGIPRLRGDERALTSGGALIDRRLQEILWADRTSPLGDRIQNSFSDRILTVAGVVGTVREWNQGDDTIGAVYVDYHQRPSNLDAMHFVVRYTGSAASAVRVVRAAIATADPMVPATVESFQDRVNATLGDRRLFMLLAGGFSAIALLLSAAGVHAMAAFLVARQRREAAIRLALGAEPSSVLRRVLGQGLLPAVAGVVIGLLCAVPLGTAMRAQLFQVRPSDPLVMVVAAAAVAIAAIMASALPARRAARIDPAAALRQE